DAAGAQASMEAQELLAGPFHLAPRISARSGDDDRRAANSGKLLLGGRRLGLGRSFGLGTFVGRRSIGRLVCGRFLGGGLLSLGGGLLSLRGLLVHLLRRALDGLRLGLPPRVLL